MSTSQVLSCAFAHMTGLSVMRLQDVWKRALEVVSRDVVARGAHFFFGSKPWFLQTQNVEAVKKSDWHSSTVSSSVRAWHHWFSLVVKMRGSNEVYLHQLGDIRSMSGPRRHQLTSATWDAILAQLWPAGSFQIVLHTTCDGVKEAERFWDECCR